MLGLEVSANKLGVGIVKHFRGQLNTSNRADVLCNIRDTYIAPPGEGFYREILLDILGIGLFG